MAYSWNFTKVKMLSICINNFEKVSLVTSEYKTCLDLYFGIFKN